MVCAAAFSAWMRGETQTTPTHAAVHLRVDAGANRLSSSWNWQFVALFGLIGLYALGLALFSPPVALNSDEAQYVRQAVAYAQGQTRVPERDVLTGKVREELPSTYPTGTSLLQTPFVFVGGWAAACWASFTALAVLTFVTALWLRRRGLPVSYAALVPLFVPASVLGRTGMGDLPSAAIVVTCLFFLERSAKTADATVGGFLGGASLAFRDSNPVFVGPWLIGCLLRREGRGIALVCATSAGVAVRFILAWVLQGDALLLRPAYPFMLGGAGERALLYAAALTFFVPGGLAALALYKGPRKPELTVTVLFVWVFFSLYSYSGQHSGLIASLILGPRYVVPLVPLLALAIASVISGQVASERLRRGLELSVLVAAGIVTCVVHPLLHHLAEQQARLVRTLYATTTPDALLVTEPGATAKYLNGLYGPRSIADKQSVPPEKLAWYLRKSRVQLVFIDRSESEYWRQMADLNQRYIELASRVCKLTSRADLESGVRLRVFDVVRCQ